LLAVLPSQIKLLALRFRSRSNAVSLGFGPLGIRFGLHFGYAAFALLLRRPGLRIIAELKCGIRSSAPLPIYAANIETLIFELLLYSLALSEGKRIELRFIHRGIPMSISSTTTFEDKEKWLLRPLSIASSIAWFMSIGGFVYFYFGIYEHETIILMLIAALAVNAGLLIWCTARIARAARGQG
jgi:hypothetical protein